MVEEREWRIDNEGVLARTWEKRLMPREERAGRSDRVAPSWFKIVGWIAGLWAGAAIASLLAIHVMMMSYHYDQLNQEYASLVRQNQSLGMSVASMTSARSLAQDAAKLKVQVVIPQPMRPSVMTVRSIQTQPSSSGAVARITRWIRNLSRTLVR